MAAMIRWAGLLAAMALSSCQNGYVPDKPDPAFELDGNYRAISDCVFPVLGNGSWKMTPLDTKKMVSFSFEPSGFAVHRIDVFAIDDTHTKVVPYLMRTVTSGKVTISDEVTRIFTDCSKQVAITPLSKDPG